MMRGLKVPNLDSLGLGGVLLRGPDWGAMRPLPSQPGGAARETCEELSGWQRDETTKPLTLARTAGR
jgi:hypothetical protein